MREPKPTNGSSCGQAAVIAHALGGKRSGAGFAARCPAHNDKTPSLTIADGDSGVLVRCHAGCSQRDVLDALRSRGLWPDNGDRPKPDREEYDYLDASGVKVVTVVRRDMDDGKRIHREPKGVKKPAGGYPPYRLTSLIANADKPVLAVEGERTADCAQDLFGDRYEATTAIGGAGKAAMTDWTRLAGHAVTCWPDADPPGREHGEAVARLCAEAGAASVRMVDTTGLPNGWDLADRAPDGFDIEAALENAVSCSQPYKAGTRKRKLWTRYADLIAEPREAGDDEVQGLIPLGGTVLIVGPAKAGKSTLGQTLGCHHAAGRPFLGRGVRQGPSLYLTHEGGRAALAARLEAMGGGEDLPLTVYHGPRPDEPLAFLAEGIEQTGATLAVIDPLFRMFDFPDGNDYAAVTASTAPLIELAEATGCALVFVHHARKGGGAGGEEALGSTAIFGAVDTLISVKRTDDTRTAYSIQREGVDMPETLLTLGADGTIDIGQTRREAEDAEARQGILEFLADCGDKAPTRDDIETAMQGRTARVRRALATLVKGGEIVRHGEGRKGHPFRFSLPDSR